MTPRRALTLLPILLCLASCQKETQVQKANREKILLVGNSADPKSLDPHLVTGVIEHNVIRALLEGLVSDDEEGDTKYPPGAATHWEHNENYTEWTFHLRQDGKWSDGYNLTTGDFLFAYHRLLHPDLAGPYAEMLYFLKNAEDYNKNLRGKILIKAGEVPGVTWEEAEKIAFGGDPETSIKKLGKSPDWDKLGEEDRRLLLHHDGLDTADRKKLDWVAEKPAERYPWPEGLRPEVAPALLAAMAKHAADGNQPETDLFDLAKVGVAASDDYTLNLTMREPVPFLLGMTRHYTWFPLPRHVVLRNHKMTDRFTEWSEPGNFVGNGAFVLTEWKINDHIETVKNPLYWDAANVKLNGVRFVPVDNFFTETRGFLAGQLHTTYQLPQQLVDKVKAEHPEFLRQEPYVATDFIRCNITRKHLDNPKVRMALSKALDRQKICDNIWQGNKPAGTICPDMGDYHPDQIASYDLEGAKKLLAEAGYPNGEGFPRFKILMSASGARAVPEAVQNMWRKIGVNVDIEQKDWGAYVTAQQNKDYDLAIASWAGDYLDPSTFLLMWTKDNGNNNTGWSNPEYERLLSEGAKQADPAQRLAMFKQAERLFIEDQAILPMGYRGRNYLLRPEVKGWHPLLLDNHPWHTISLEP